MRYVETSWRLAAIVTLTIGLSGCASLTAMLQAFRNAFSSHPTPTTASAAAPKAVVGVGCDENALRNACSIAVSDAQPERPIVKVTIAARRHDVSTCLLYTSPS